MGKAYPNCRPCKARAETVFELAIIGFLILLNGVFALSELAVVSSRRARLRVFAAAGRKGARKALELSTDPGRFLSTVQIGITLVGILAGAYSGATFGADMALWLESLGVPGRVAEPLGFGIIVAGLTFLSLIIGELVPKHLALRKPEEIACAVAPAMSLMSRVAAPLVWLLNISTRLVLRILGRTARSPRDGDGRGNQEPDCRGGECRCSRSRRAAAAGRRDAAGRSFRKGRHDAAHGGRTGWISPRTKRTSSAC